MDNGIYSFTNDDNSAEAYIFSGAYSSGRNNPGDSQEYDFVFWEFLAESTLSWDAVHWTLGWFGGVNFAIIVFFCCRCLCPQKKRARWILTMAAFIIGFWAYIAALLGSIMFVLLGLFSRIIYLIYKQCGCYKVMCPCCVKFISRRRDARMLRERALSNPSWRRRSWLVLLRTRRKEFPRTRGRRRFKWFVSRREGTRYALDLPLTINDAGMVVDNWPCGTGDSFQHAVIKVVGLPEEGLFRKIISYL